MKLSFEEQIKILDGQDVWNTKSFGDVPSLLMTDGPHGVRKQIDNLDTVGKNGSVLATCFPTASLTACSFDRQLLKKLGQTIARECKANGVQMILGPGMNIKRTPLCGRNFEYFSEDPFLSGELAASFVRAVEDQGVGTSVKHFIANSQESYRFTIDSIIDNRALNEIYYKNFKRVLKENPASMMASYNKLNGYYLTESPILKNVVRKKWNYQGVIVSDWGAIHDRVKSIKASCDLEMPSTYGYWEHQISRASDHDFELAKDITTSANRIVELATKYKVEENVEQIDFAKQNEQARSIARESMVLAKNKDSILPLNHLENVAIISGFIDKMRYQGGGSSHVNAAKVSEIVDVIGHFSNNTKLAKGFDLTNFKSDNKLEAEALELANQVKKVIYIIGIPEMLETEGFDRKTLDLPINQIELFKKLYEVNKNIVIVVVGGSVVNLAPFAKAKGVLISYLGGQASSLAMLDILYGKVSPSGRLAETWIDDHHSCNVQITNDNNAIYYDESIYVGYRFYETFRRPVRYHFGHGLSYAKFSYKEFKVTESEEGYLVSVDVKNMSNIIAKEVVMIFVGNNESTVYKAKRELKAFDKIELKPNETKTVEFLLTRDDFSFYGIYKKKFIVEEGTYTIDLCKHAGEVIEQLEVQIKGDIVKHPMISYNQYSYNTSDFCKIYDSLLPLRNVVRKRPFDLSSTLNDVDRFLIGKMVKHLIVHMGLKQAKHSEDIWFKEVMKRSIVETPIRMLALFSNQQISLRQAEGIVDILNLHFIQGIKKLSNK
ncbi:MAG: glycoside hydrolase family 3 C-terminal domain-containing protein [Acholeplasmataceae bacterium]